MSMMPKNTSLLLVVALAACGSATPAPTPQSQQPEPAPRTIGSAPPAQAAPAVRRCDLPTPVVAPAPAARGQWVAAVRAEPKACLAAHSDALLRAVRKLHEDALAASDAASAAQVVELYQLFITHVPAHKEAGRVRYDRAALLGKLAAWQTDRAESARLWEQAAIAFTAAAESGALDDKRRKGAAGDAVQSWKNALRAAPPRVDRKGDEGSTPVPIPERRQQMIAAFRAHARHLSPADAELWKLLYLEAREYWQYRHYDRAIPIFRRIVAGRPRDELALYSANLWLDSLGALGREDEMARTVRALLGNAALLSKRRELASRLRLIRYQSDRRAADRLAKEGDFSGCAKAFTEVYKRDMGMPGMDEVLYNGSVCAERAGNKKRAIALIKTLLSGYPKSRLAEQARESLRRLQP